MSVERVKKQATGSYLFESDYYDEDGSRVAVTAAGSVTVKDGGGTTVFTGTPTLSSGSLNVSIPVATFPRLDIYEFTWSGTAENQSVSWTSDVELVGGFLFEIADLRKEDRAFADTTKYPTAVLREIRNWVEDVIEGPRAASVAFVPRGSRVVMDGRPWYSGGSYGQQVPHFELRSVYSGSVDGVALTEPQVSGLVCDDNTVWRNDTTWRSGHRNVAFHYEHGHDRAPGAITRAALMLAREYLVKSDVPGRATATTIGDQMFRLTIAGRDGVTGLPEVDAAIEQFGRKTFRVG